MLVKILSLLGVILSFVVPGLSEAATFNVTNGADFQAALSAAATNGQSDTINMASGTYNSMADGPFVYSAGINENQSLTIVGNAGSTFIDGGDSVRGLLIRTTTVTNPNDTNADITIRNVFFQNGRVVSNDVTMTIERGGGLNVLTNSADILLDNCLLQNNLALDDGDTLGTSAGANIETETGQATVQNCAFQSNAASSSGGGLRMTSDSGDLILENSDFGDNQASAPGVGVGGGAAIQSSNGGQISVLGATFSQNTASFFGGGLVLAASNVELQNSTFTQNESEGLGGGLVLTTLEDDNNASVTNNIFSFNRSLSQGANPIVDIGGGGILILSEHTLNADLLHNTFFGNSAERGGGMSVFLTNDNSSVDIVNSIIFGNVASLTGDDLFLFDDADNLFVPGSENGTGSEVTIRNSDFTELISTCQASASCTDNLTLSDNIDEDPLFVDFSTDDFHLTENSPCIDAGINQSNLPLEDLDGNLRPVGAAPDMGAFEFGAEGGGGGCSLIR